MTDEERARQFLSAQRYPNTPVAPAFADVALLAAAFAEVRRETVLRCAKVAEEIQDEYRSGASVMARGFGRAIAESIRALLDERDEGKR